MSGNTHTLAVARQIFMHLASYSFLLPVDPGGEMLYFYMDIMDKSLLATSGNGK